METPDPLLEGAVDLTNMPPDPVALTHKKKDDDPEDHGETPRSLQVPSDAKKQT